MSKPTTTIVPKPTTTIVATNTTKPVIITPVATPVATPAKSTSYAAAPAGNWLGALIGFAWVYFMNYLYLGLISWWWIPIDAILFGNWTDFYMFFISNSASFGSYVQSYSIVMNP